ncbi:MAG TPA: helix-turn-helix domain-containing protein [Nocardioides sp.]
MRPAAADLIARHRAARVAPLAERLVAMIGAENRGYAEVPVVPVDDLRASCVANVGRVLQLLAVELGLEVDGDRDLYDAARATGRRRAEQGLPLDDVLRSFRMGGRLIWDDLLDGSDGTLDALETREVGTALWAVVDRTSAAVAAEYHQTEATSVRVHEQRRTALWEDLLAGRGADPAFAAEAARVLDLGPGPCVVVVAPADIPGEVGRRAETHLRVAGHRSSWVRRAAGLVGVVEAPGGSADALAPALRTLDAGPTGVSGAVPGFGQVEEAFGHAVAAQRIAVARGLPVVAFDDALPDALVLAAPPVAARLARHWLGPLLDLPADESRALLDTLEAWVAAGGSPTATARALPCHRNTVLNRLRRVHRLTSGRLGEGAPPVELSLALAAHRLGIV